MDEPIDPTYTFESVSSTLPKSSRQASLEALRGRLAWEIDHCRFAADLVKLAIQFRACLVELDEIAGVKRPNNAVNSEVADVRRGAPAADSRAKSIDEIARQRERRRQA